VRRLAGTEFGFREHHQLDEFALGFPKHTLHCDDRLRAGRSAAVYRFPCFSAGVASRTLVRVSRFARLLP
jgi:hypothetical protein